MSRRSPAKVYPRVCGGTSPALSMPSGGKGLSPRVRGNPPYPLVGTNSRRSIPACAGEPGIHGVNDARQGVYPRVCGGTWGRPFLPRPLRGLSPRVRGNQFHRIAVAHLVRSIPACAGEPMNTSAPVLTPEVYPRVCGGTVDGRTDRRPGEGLSPRVRGNQNIAVSTPEIERSIPACAGEPRLVRSSPAVLGVYPRVCGGTAATGYAGPTRMGLSPRVRGNPLRKAPAIGERRSIPACAGEPLRRCAVGGLPPVYPRVCGGTRRRGMAGRRKRGLSPRVRGNP